MVNRSIPLFALIIGVASGFQIQQRVNLVRPSLSVNGADSSPLFPDDNIKAASKTTSTQLSMYNLPPSGGGGNNGLKEIAMSALTLLGIVAFFASPLGGVFFFAVNSVFVLLLLIPVVGIISFNVWQYLNTIEGPCPSCGAPTRVVKNEGFDNEDGEQQQQLEKRQPMPPPPPSALPPPLAPGQQ